LSFVRLALKVVRQDDGDFMDVILLNIKFNAEWGKKIG
jgi:hypothetical protein